MYRVRAAGLLRYIVARCVRRRDSARPGTREIPWDSRIFYRRERLIIKRENVKNESAYFLQLYRSNARVVYNNVTAYTYAVYRTDVFLILRASSVKNNLRKKTSV